MVTAINIPNNQFGQQEPLTDEQSWVNSIKTSVGKKLFNDIQFLSCDKAERFGSDWQREVCRLVSCPAEEQERFWRDKEMPEARKALNKRRQNTNNAMKKVFLGKDGSAGVLVLFANNS
jgi:hypothetical protein